VVHKDIIFELKLKSRSLCIIAAMYRSILVHRVVLLNVRVRDGRRVLSGRRGCEALPVPSVFEHASGRTFPTSHRSPPNRSWQPHGISVREI
jgi:hypothetical protein